MAKDSLTPQEYELHLKDLRERLRLYLDGGGGDLKQLMKDAEAVLELAEAFPEVLEHHTDVEGLVAELLARRQQAKFGTGRAAPRQGPGCLLGWLTSGRGKPTDNNP